MHIKFAGFSIFLRSGLLALLLTNVSGCSLFGTDSPPQQPESASPDSAAAEPPQTSTVGVDNLAEKKAGALSDIEVLWQVPTEPVEGFVIQYGQDAGSMDQKTKVLSTDLEKIEDSKHGSVYRFVLGGIPLNQTIFISIAAFNGDDVSANSSVFEVRGESGMLQ